MSDASTVDRLVTFRVGGDLYATDIFAIERVLRYEPARAVPNLPAWMEGVLEHGGRLIPVIDLRKRFGLRAPAPGPQARLLIVASGGEWVGAIVDQVLDIRAVTAADVAPPPSVVRGIAGDYLRGVVRRGDALVVVLDPDRLFGTTERIDIASATALAGEGTHG